MMAKIKERKSESWKPGMLHDDGFISKNKKRKDKRMSLNLSAKKIDTEEFIPIKKSAFAFIKTNDTLKSTPNKLLSPALDKKHTPKKKDTPLPAFGSKKQAKNVSTPNPRKLSLFEDSCKLNGTPKLNSNSGDSSKKSKEGAGSQKMKSKAAGTPKIISETVDDGTMKSKLAGTPKANKAFGAIQVKSEPARTPKANKAFGAIKVKSDPAGTPKVNLESAVKSSLKKKVEKFIDHEVEEGEEPVTDKGVKPYVKGQNRKSISFKFNDEEIDDSDQSDYSDDGEIAGVRDFLDEEASEGEETDQSDSDESSDDDGEDSDTFNNFLADDSGDDDDSDEEDSDESDESDEEEQISEGQFTKIVPVSPFNSVKKGYAKDDDDSKNDKNGKKQLSKLKKFDIEAISKPTSVSAIPLGRSKNENIETVKKNVEPSSKKTKLEENVVQKAKKKEKKSKEDNEVPPPVTTDYAGFIKYLPSSITSDQIKTALTSAVSAENIVSVVFRKNKAKKNKKCFVYVPDEDSLDKLENKTFTINKISFKVFKARESKKLVKTQPMAFLPRVPLSIDNEKLKSIIASDIGTDKIISLKSKFENEKLQTRNVLIELTDVEVLKKIVLKGSYTYKGIDVIVRQAFESGFTIPVHRVVLSDIPENTTEAALKKAVELKIGEGTVIAVKFSFRKNSFAFVTLNNELSQNKLLEPGIEILINKTKLTIREFKPRVRAKRGRTKKKVEETPPTKKQKLEQSSPERKSSKSKKARKKKAPSPSSESLDTSTKTEPNSSQKKSQPSKKSVQNAAKHRNQSSKQSQNNIQDSSPKKVKQQQQGSPSSSSSPENKKAKNQTFDKKSNLNSKLEKKKNKLKDKKNKKKKAE